MDAPLIKRIFQKVETPKTKLNGHDLSESFRVDGYREAVNNCENLTILKYELLALYRRYLEWVKQNNRNINALAESLKITNESLKKEIDQIRDVVKRIKTVAIPDLYDQMEKVKEEIADIKANPQKYLGEKIDKVTFYIGYTILALLTAYLIIFYSSASYSAFFRVFEPGVNIREAMLDPNTFIKAFNDGIGELMFILLNPFVFLALGWLIKKFIERKLFVNYVKVILLLSVTFVFDGFLAYKITESIAALNMGPFSEEYTVTTALHDINFWVVIFCGFVTYIIWGLVFEFVMKANQNSDQIGILIKLNNEKIGELDRSILIAHRDIETHVGEIDNKNLEIARNNETISTPVILVDDIKRIHHEFMCGWLRRMRENNLPSVSFIDADRIADHCLDDFIFNKTNPYYNEKI